MMFGRLSGEDMAVHSRTRIAGQKRHTGTACTDGKPAAEMSWYQTRPTRSLELIAEAGVGPDGAIIDVGGGAMRRS